MYIAIDLSLSEQSHALTICLGLLLCFQIWRNKYIGVPYNTQWWR